MGRTIPVARVQAMHEGKRRARARRTDPGVPADPCPPGRGLPGWGVWGCTPPTTGCPAGPLVESRKTLAAPVLRG